MDGQEKTGFLKFRETKLSQYVGIILALLVSTLLVAFGFVYALDGLIVAVLAYFILRFFRVRDIRLLLLCAALMFVLFSLVIYYFVDFVDSAGNVVVYTLPRTMGSVLLTFIFPFLILCVMSWWMRRNLERTRARMEAEGRLYPQGYGRCKRCGSLVLPGEIMCRKCGEYVDVPEEMRVKKVNYFECSECGREVPQDAGVCPFCGEAFEDDSPKQIETK